MNNRFEAKEKIKPNEWWRKLCQVNDRIHLCGDLPHPHYDSEDAIAVLSQWVKAGITHIVDVRDEASDAAWVAASEPQITYHHLGTHDNGGAQEFRWFDQGVQVILTALEEPDTQIVVHCHMGINRAPSMVFAALLELGYGIQPALNAIRSARPISGIIYAEDAVSWYGNHNNWGETEIFVAREEVRQWHKDNPVDVGWVISRIRVTEMETL